MLNDKEKANTNLDSNSKLIHDSSIFELENFNHVIKKLGDSNFPFTCREFQNALYDEMVEVESARISAQRVLDGDMKAEIEFRSWLSQVSDDVNEKEFIEDLEKSSKSNKTDKTYQLSGKDHFTFLSADAFVDLYFAAATIARDDNDWNTLSNQIDLLNERLEWIESFHAAANYFNETGDPTKFQQLGWLYARNFEEFYFLNNSKEVNPKNSNVLREHTSRKMFLPKSKDWKYENE